MANDPKIHNLGHRDDEMLGAQGVYGDESARSATGSQHPGLGDHTYAVGEPSQAASEPELLFRGFDEMSDEDTGAGSSLAKLQARGVKISSLNLAALNTGGSSSVPEEESESLDDTGEASSSVPAPEVEIEPAHDRGESSSLLPPLEKQIEDMIKDCLRREWTAQPPSSDENHP